MAEKVGDIYVDLSVRMDNTSKAVKDLGKAFSSLAKNGLSLKPSIDKSALAQIGKAGATITREWGNTMKALRDVSAWKTMQRNATSGLAATEKSLADVEKRLTEVARSTAAGKVKWKAYIEASNPEAQEAAWKSWAKYVEGSTAKAVKGLRDERDALKSTADAQRALGTAAQSALGTVNSRVLGLARVVDVADRAFLKMPGVVQSAMRGIGNTVLSLGNSAFEGLARSAERSSSRAASALDSVGEHGRKAFGVLRFQAYLAIAAVERVFANFIRDGIEASASIGYTAAALKQINVNAIRAADGYNKMSKAQQKAIDPKIYRQATKAANALVQRFIQFSQTTPYTIDQIQQVGQQLVIAREGMVKNVGSGFKLMKVLRSIGDIAAATGRGVEGMQSAAYVLQQIGQSGQVASDDFRQLHNAIPNFREIIAKQLDKPLKDINNKVVNTPKGIKALFDGLQKGGAAIGTFGGVLEAQNETVAGQFARMKETITNGVAQIINAFGPVLMPIFGGIADAAQKLTNKLIPFSKDIAPKIAAFANSLKGGGKGGQFFTDLGNGAKFAIGYIETIYKDIGELGKRFGTAFAENGGIDALKNAFAGIKSFLSTMAPIIQKFADQIMGVLGPAFSQIGAYLATDLIPAFSRFIVAIQPVAKFLLEIFGGAVLGIIKGFVGVVQGALKIITGVLNVFTGLLTGNWKLAWNGLKQILSGALQAIIGAIRIWLNIGIINLLKGGFLRLLPTIFRAGWKIIFTVFKGGVEASGAIFRALPGLLRTIGEHAMSLLAAGIRLYAKFVLAELKVLLVRLPAALKSLGPLLGRVALGALRAMAAAIRGALHFAVEAAKALGPRMTAGLGSLWHTFSGIGVDIVKGIASGISNAWSWVKGAVEDLANHIPGWAKKVLGIGSPSKVMAKEVGKWIPAGIAVGITSNLKTVTKAMTDLAIKVGKAGEKGASAIVKRFGDRLKSLAGKMDWVNTLLAAAQKRLQDLKDIRQGYVDVFTGWADLSSLGNLTDSEGNQFFNFDQALSDMQAVEDMANNIATLGKQAIAAGLDQNSLDAILQLGPQAAQQWLQGIVAGGKTAADKVDGYFSTLTSAGGALGDAVLRQFENASVAGANAYVTQLQKQQKTLQTEFEALATAFTKQLIKELNSTKGGINVGYGPKKKNKKKAIGSMSWKGGPVDVGEFGRETVDLPPRTRIRTTHASDTLAKQNEGPVDLSADSLSALAAIVVKAAQIVSVRASSASISGAATRIGV